MVKDIQVIWEMVANMEIGFILKIVILNEWNAGVGKKLNYIIGFDFGYRITHDWLKKLLRHNNLV